MSRHDPTSFDVAIQAVPDDAFERFKQHTHGAHAASTLRFAENAEQQQDIDNDDTMEVPKPSRLAASSSEALAGRLAPDHGLPGSLHSSQVRRTPWFGIKHKPIQY